MSGLGKRDDRGDAAGSDDEQQPQHDLVGGLGIVAFPIPDERPARPHVHDAEAEKAEDGTNGGDELRDVPRIRENLADSVTKGQDGLLPAQMDEVSGRAVVG